MIRPVRRVFLLLLAPLASMGDEAYPRTWSPVVLMMKPDWYGSPAARATANNIILYQSPAGGWPKDTNLLAPATPQALAVVQRANRSDHLNEAATPRAIRFLANVATMTGDVSCQRAVDRGVDYLLRSQYRSGGFPLAFPLRGGLSDHVTFRGSTTVQALGILRDIAQGKSSFGWMTADQRTVAAEAVARGVDYMLRAQLRRNGKRIGWCARYDVYTLKPIAGRALEPVALYTAETVEILQFLMSVDNPTAQVSEAVEEAVQWLERIAIHGQRFDTLEKEGQRPERRLVPDPAAPPLWSRLYDLMSDRPVYMGPPGELTHDYDRVPMDGRLASDHIWVTPATLLNKDYPAWKARTRQPPTDP